MRSEGRQIGVSLYLLQQAICARGWRCINSRSDTEPSNGRRRRRVDRPSDRSSDSIRRPTPAVVRASIMEFGFPFFRTAPTAICARRPGKGVGRETDYCYGVRRPSEFTDIASLSRSDSVFTNIAPLASIYLYQRL